MTDPQKCLDLNVVASIVDEGKQAALKGMLKSANPYAFADQRSVVWIEGWEDGREIIRSKRFMTRLKLNLDF